MICSFLNLPMVRFAVRLCRRLGYYVCIPLKSAYFYMIERWIMDSSPLFNPMRDKLFGATLEKGWLHLNGYLEPPVAPNS